MTVNVFPALNRHRPRMDRVSLAIHAQPELPFGEHHAVSTLTTWLAEAGFTIECPAGGLDTAFVARHEGSRPGPTVAVLMEYDAIAGLGHGCGHDLIAAGGALAAIAAAETVPDHAGTLLAIGTPAEEGVATGCTAEVEPNGPTYADRINNLTLARRCADYLAEAGITLEPPSPTNPAGSSDIGNVSRAVPAIHPYLQIVERGTPGHSEEMREGAATPEAHDRTALMAAAIARTALDALSDEEFFAEVRNEHSAVEGARA